MQTLIGSAYCQVFITVWYNHTISFHPSATNKHKNNVCHSSDAFDAVWIREYAKLAQSRAARPPL